MARHLLAIGYALTVYNRMASKADGLISCGATLMESPCTAAAVVDVIFLMVGFSSDVRSTSLDPSTGALASLGLGVILVDMTTSDPTLTSEIAAETAATDTDTVDASIFDDDCRDRNATISIFAGNHAAVVTHLVPLLQSMDNTLYMGEPGVGQCAKLGNQIVIASTTVGLVEGMVYAHMAGIDIAKWL
ncbi:hypothetical protein ABZP36_028731 [Zizania latifolia]